MFRALQIAVDGNPEALVQAIIRRVAIGRNHRTIRIVELGSQQENVSPGVGGQSVEVLEDASSDSFGWSVYNQMHIHVDGRTSLMNGPMLARDACGPENPAGAGTQKNSSTYQHDRGLIQDSRPHLSCHLPITCHTDVGHQPVRPAL